MTAATTIATDWADRAACRGVSPELFYPAKGGGHAGAKRAKAFCAVCPVTADCLAAELAQGLTDQHGVRGNTTPEERRRMIRASRRTDTTEGVKT